MAAKPVRIAIIANASQAQRELSSFSSGVSNSFRRVGRIAAIGAVVAGAALLKLGTDSVKAASDSQQSLGATETVFGKFADKVVTTSKKAATAYGLSANQYRESANLLGSLFRNQGVAVDQLAGKTQQMVGVGTDLAATFGGTTSEAVQALSAAFKGEFDSLEKYGVSLKQSTVNTEAMALAQKKHGKSLEDLSLAQQTAIKQQATSNLIMEQSARSRGAFARETNTLAHQQQVLGATIENLKAKLGSVLLPILTTVFAYLSSTAIPATERLAKTIGDFLAPYVDKAKAAFSDLMDKLQPVADWLAKHPEIIKGAGIALGIAAAAALAFAAAMVVVSIATSPITLVVLAVVALGAAIAYAYKNSETFRNAIAAIGVIAQQVFGWLKTNVLPILIAIGLYYVAMFQRLRSTTSSALAIIERLWAVFGDTITSFLSNSMKNLKNIVEGGLKVIRGVIAVVTGIIKGDWKQVWSGIKLILSGAWQAIRGIVSQGVNLVRTLLSAAWDAAKALTSAAWNGIKTAVSKAISGMLGYVRSIPGKVTGAIGDLGGLLLDVGASIIQGLIDGITSKVDDLEGMLNAVTDKIPDWKGPKEKDKNLLKPTGRWIMEGLIDGIADGSEGVKRVLGRLTTMIEKSITGKNQEKREKAHLRRLKERSKALLRNAKAQDKLNKKVLAARDALQEMRNERRDYAASVKASVVDYTNITGFDVAFNPKSIAAEMRKRLEKVRRFTAVIKDLIARGLNQTTIAQLVAAGAEGGLAYAVALQSGGTEAVTEINDLQSQVEQAAGVLGNTAATDMYGAGIAAAEGLLKGLEASAKALDKVARRLARQLVQAIKKELGIKSPSKVFEAIGDNVTKGLTIGLDATYVKRSGAVLASSLTKGFGVPALEAYASTSEAAAAPTQVSVRLTAEQLSAVQRGRSIQIDLDAYAKAGGRKGS